MFDLYYIAYNVHEVVVDEDFDHKLHVAVVAAAAADKFVVDEDEDVDDRVRHKLIHKMFSKNH